MVLTQVTAADLFEAQIKPILEEYCGDCHLDGAKKGGLKLDGWESVEALKKDHQTWTHVLEQLEHRIMPPSKEPKPKDDELNKLISLKVIYSRYIHS